MSAPVGYAVPARRHQVEQAIDRSRFVCTVDRAPTAEEAQRLVRDVAARYADATHNCWAYVAGPPGSTNQVGMSDAGEPHGTAGRPMLTVLLHGGVGEIAAVVTRYYGGVKLGTGGLVRAYGGLVQLALESLPRAQRVDYASVTVRIGYAAETVVRQLLASLGAEVDDAAYDARVRYRARVPRARLGALRAAVADATRGDGVVEPDADDAPG